MLRGARELIAGMHLDPQFGRCVMVGIGGVLAEAVADVVFRLAPLDDARRATRCSTTCAAKPSSANVRGEPALDRTAAAQALLALSRLVEDRPDITSIDVNPLILVDGAPVAVDALVEIA